MPTRSPEVVAEFRLKLTIGIVLLAGGAALVAAYAAVPEWRGELVFASQVAAGVAALYSAFYVSETLQTGIRQHEQKLAFDLVEGVQNVDLTRLRSVLDKVDFQAMNQKEAYLRVTGDDELLAASRGLLNRFERIAVAIRQGAADEDILYLDLNIMIPWYYKRLGGYIEELRSARKSNDIYVEVKDLVDAWERKKSLRTGKTLAVASKS